MKGENSKTKHGKFPKAFVVRLLDKIQPKEHDWNPQIQELIYIYALPETNSKHPWNLMVGTRSFPFWAWLIFRCYVSFREDIYIYTYIYIYIHILCILYVTISKEYPADFWKADLTAEFLRELPSGELSLGWKIFGGWQKCHTNVDLWKSKA